MEKRDLHWFVIPFERSVLSFHTVSAGVGRWTIRLLAERMVELGYVESVSHETVRQTLKKTN